MEQILVRQRCPRCNSYLLVTDSITGEIVCQKCASVLSDRIEEFTKEWAAYNKEEYDQLTSTGRPTSLAKSDMGLSTVIGQEDRDVTGRPFSSSMKNVIERLRTWDNRTQTYHGTDRNFRNAFSLLNRLKDKLGLSDVIIEKTAYIYRKAMEKELVRGRSIDGVLGASLYAVCRNTETPRTLDEISNSLAIRRRYLSRCYRELVRELDLKIPVPDPIKCVPRIASNAGISEKTKRKALELLEKAKNTGFSAGKDPMGLAAAALYIACLFSGQYITQKQLAAVSSVSEVTVRNIAKMLREFLGYKKEPILHKTF